VVAAQIAGDVVDLPDLTALGGLDRDVAPRPKELDFFRFARIMIQLPARTPVFLNRTGRWPTF
jgi:hypothetical protein